MRILCVSNLYSPHVGGIEVMLAEMLPRLVDRGHDVTAVSSSERPDLPAHEMIDGVSVRRVDMIGALQSREPARILRAQQAFAAARAEAMPDVVMLQDLGPAAWFEFRTRGTPRDPTVVTLQTELPIDALDEDSVIVKVLTSADWVTAVSRSALEWGRSLAHFDRSSVIPNAVTIGSTDAAPSPVPTLVCVGRLTAQKGFDVAIDAMAQVRASHPHARLLIAGEGFERQALEQRARERDLGDAVELVGLVDRDAMTDLLASAHAIVMPSRYEGMPLVALEAAHAGRPIVASRVSGIPEVVVDGVTGLLVDPEDPVALANALELVLADPAGAEAMGRAAREHVGDRYGIEATVDSYEEILRVLATVT